MIPEPLTSHSRIGIDVGRVLVGASTDGSEPDISFLTASNDEAVRIPPEPGAFDFVRDAVECTGGHVHVVSKCGTRIQALTRAWLEHQRFYAQTGVRPDQVHFVKKRPDKRLVAGSLGLTHFVDDRVDVLLAMRGLVPFLVWFGARANDRTHDWLTPAPSWASVRAHLLG